MMKKFLIILAVTVFIVPIFAQTTFATYHNMNDIWLRVDENEALKATLASPTFTGTVTIPSPFTLGATSVTTTGAKLNYLTGATGTTGTNTTNIVFSTSPVLTTPNLGTPSTLVGTNISGTGASFTAGAVTGFTPASGSLTLAGADAVTITTTASTNVTLPTTGTLVASSVTDLLAPLASPPFTGTITQLTPTAATSGYVDLYTGEWTPSEANTSGGTNGVYAIVNPIKNFQNAYGLRSRVDLRDAAAGVGFNQIHAVDGLINLSEEIYSVDDNISVFGGAIHSVGITAGDVDSTGTLNMFFGVFPESLTEDFTVETNAMKIITWSDTHVDYGFNYENSGTTLAGIYLNNHASNSPATMTNGILMKSAAGNMTYGVNMTDAGITTADILCQNGALIENTEADTLNLEETIVKVTGTLYVTGNISSGGTTSDYAITDYQPPLLDYWAKTQELNKLPAFENIDRTNIVRYINGLEESAERNLRYIMELEARITQLEND